MRLSSLQWACTTGCLLLLVVLYSFGRTKPHKKKGEETPKETVVLNDEIVLLDARKQLDSLQLRSILELENQKAQATSIAGETEVLKQLSKTWNEYQNFAAGGYYAQKVAELQPSGDAWSIAGTTYGIAFQRSQEAPTKQYAARKALYAFQQAALLEPDTVRHQINEALMYVDLSGVDATVMPMTGAQKLLALDKKFPDNIQVLMSLGRLSIMRSGDVKKATPRFERVVELANSMTIDPEILLEAHYFLTDCYKQLNQRDKVLQHYDACIELVSKEPDVQAHLKQQKKTFEETGK